VRRAYFHAKAIRKVFVKLPYEDDEPGMCGELIMAMYGTRDAAQNWEHEYSDFLTGIGFKAGKASPCVFWMESRNLRIVVHGDDFTVLGHARELDWFRQKIKERYEVKIRARIGSEIKDDKSVRILNRIVTWNENGIDYESDQRHAEIIVKELGLKPDNVKSVVTPGVKETAKEELDNEELNSHDSTKYRQLVARASYLAQDRSDIGYAVKELTRWMSKPGTKDWESLKRLGRYLKGKERMIQI
jgi:hypothetical protein